MAFTHSPFVKQLLQSGSLYTDSLEQLIRDKAHLYRNLPELLICEQQLTAFEFAQAASQFSFQNYLDLDQLDLTYLPDPSKHEALILKYQALPIFASQHALQLAVIDPSELKVIQEFEFSTGLSVEIVVVEYDKLKHILERLFEHSGFYSQQWDLTQLGVIPTEDPSAQLSDDEQPVITFINHLLLEAIRKGASDLHFEPYEKNYRIRFRIDGLLHEVASPPFTLANRLAVRLKVMSCLDIAEKRLPQDGRIKLKLSPSKSVDFRLSTLPTLWGEKIVMRILDSDSTHFGIDALGFSQAQVQLFSQALGQPQGMVLVTGPTGSGKTMTLYTALSLLNTKQINICTAEDPVELNLPGINQVQIKNKIGLTFPAALKAFLRQDPDVLMVGEIRDLETAEIAIKAAQTGHLVLSTLHTNSAIDSITRLMTMGVPAYNLVSAIHLLVAQRLVRRLCTQCKQTQTLPDAELIAQGFTLEQCPTLHLFKPSDTHCNQCTDGYKGRVGIYEVITINPELSELILQHASAAQLRALATKQGALTLRQSALQKVALGVTSLQEINRVI